MEFPPNQGLDQEEVDEQVAEALEENEVVLFMKGTELMPPGYSPARRSGCSTSTATSSKPSTFSSRSMSSGGRCPNAATGRLSRRRSSMANSSAAPIILEELEERNELAETLNAA